MKARLVLAGAAMLAVVSVAGQAAAQEDDATKAAEADAKEATQMATPSPALMNPSPSSSSSGTSHTESSSSSTSFSMSVCAAPPAPPGPPPGWRPGPNPNSGKALNGSWKLANVGGDRSCGITLSEGDDTDNPHYLITTTGGPDGSLAINRWRYDGRMLELTNTAGETYAEFRRVGRNRFEGRNVKTGEALVVSR